jgi:hypothetical protein
MMKRLLSMAAGTVLALSLVACGSSDNTGPTPTPTPTPTPKAVIHMVVDPNPVVANFQSDGWYRFKVNLGFDESAGIGFTINTIRTTITSAATGNVVLDDVSAIGKYVAGYGNTILQFTSPRYKMAGGTSAGTIAFSVSILDDRGNTITLSGDANVLHHGDPHRLP